jgi:DNA-binding NarL/FixJ family response regulator
MRHPVRLVVADSSTLLRRLLRTVCGRHGLRVVAETPSLADLLELCTTETPDVVVTAATLADGEVGPAHVSAMAGQGIRLLVVCDDPSPERLTALLAAGVSGYLMHDSAPDEIARAVAEVARGSAVLHPSAAGTILLQWRRLRDEAGSGLSPTRPELTPREIDVLTAMADGLAAKAIARRLGVAVKTVENHKIRVFDKLGVHTQAHAVSLAIGHGLLAGSSPDPS